jgi:hypothetical protein
MKLKAVLLLHIRPLMPIEAAHPCAWAYMSAWVDASYTTGSGPIAMSSQCQQALHRVHHPHDLAWLLTHACP